MAEHVQMLSVPRTAKCTCGPSAVTRERCGAPAVTGFIGSDGRHYYECAAHDGRVREGGEQDGGSDDSGVR